MGRYARLGGSLLAFLSACADSTAPDRSEDGSPGGRLDPTASEFVLEQVSATVPGVGTVPIDLVGSNLRVDRAREQVTIDVAIRNASRGDTLPAPTTVWIGCFEPGSIAVLNADAISRRPGCKPWGFVYDAAFGADGLLLPGETSQAKPWIFHDPGLVPFSFAAEVLVDVQAGPRISGWIFEDGNRNGTREPFEGPFSPGGVAVRGPDGATVTVLARHDGSYSVPVQVPGLYTVIVQYAALCQCQPPDCCSSCVTTRNPLELVLLPGPDGRLQSYTGADFGVAHGACDDPSPPVVLVDVLPSAIPQDSYALLDASLQGDLLVLRVGYSGCSASHPFTLYAGRAFAESIPPQTWVILAHDDLDEPCDAYFEATLQFDLDPIRWEHLRVYGGWGVVQLRFVDWLGNTHTFRFGP